MRADRTAALVGYGAFVLGIAGIVWGAVATSDDVPQDAVITVVSSPIPGDAVTMTTQTTAPPLRPTLEPRVTTEVTVTEGGADGEMVVTTEPAELAEPFLGSTPASITFQVILVTFASLLLAFFTHRMLTGEFGGRRMVEATPSVEVSEANAVKSDVLAATEAADLSRPLFAQASVSDPRLRLLQSRIALELEVRKLAQNHDLPSSLSLGAVVAGLVEQKKMSPKLASAVTALSDLGDRLGEGAPLSPDATTLLTDAYNQALAKVGGKLKKS